MKVHKILIPLIIALTLVLIQGCAVDDRALDGNPTWSPDGNYVLFDSDRDGIFNIYAYELATQKHFRC